MKKTAPPRLTVRQAAKLVKNAITGKRGVSTKRLHVLIAEGRIEAVRTIHGLWAVSRRSVERFNARPRKQGYPFGRPRKSSAPTTKSA